jgi:antitoxin component YwqK of YwqJK toxin-antitoxin module
MKKIFTYLLLFFAISNIVKSQDTIIVYYDEEWKEIANEQGAFYYRNTILNSNNVWIVNDYYINNKIQMSGSFKSKKLKQKHGYFTYYFENGVIDVEGIYQNDNREDEWKYYYENGQLESQGKFLKNKKENDWVYYYENGQIKAAGKNLNNKKDGEWNYWYESGKLKSQEYFKNGEVYLDKNYFENGNNDYSGKYLNDKKQGVWTYWNSEGRIVMKGNFNKGMRDGEWIRYFRNGNMKLYYINGELVNSKLGGIVRRK